MSAVSLRQGLMHELSVPARHRGMLAAAPHCRTGEAAPEPFRLPAAFRLALLFATLLCSARGDVYLHNPRGSNNKLSEQSNNAQNQERMFDSQNNANGGYQIGDKCNPVCHQDDSTTYDETKPGAMQGDMRYYQGSELYIEWAAQHACGAGNMNIICQIVIQYMCEADNPGIRDGTKRGNQNKAGGEQEPPDTYDAGNPNLGQHEPVEFYLDCRARERNKGLYTADRNMNENSGATATRQNPNGNGNGNNNNRNGLECPEERDYYPYWHPTPWHDIVVLTDEPLARCAYYQAESQNVKAKNYCSVNTANNAFACGEAGGQWLEARSFDEPPPECVAGVRQRDNHNGNSVGAFPQYYMWKIPDYIQGRCALRLRYNMTSGDFRGDSLIKSGRGGSAPVATARRLQTIEYVEGDYFFVDHRMNKKEPNSGGGRRRRFTGGPPVLRQDPPGDFVRLGGDYQLQLQVNTNQYGRTFEDRTHSFRVEPMPSEIPSDARVVNYNVRGRRGNIVQVYPSVEYDFVPTDLTVEEGTWLHFQWTGSDANAQGNDGNGRQATDRNNLVQVYSREENVPLPIEAHKLLFDAAEEGTGGEGDRAVKTFAYLHQNEVLQSIGESCDQDPQSDNAITNCQQLNGASAYFDGGLVPMLQVGTHYVVSTRNNDFSNRSQKATIRVVRYRLRWWEVMLIVAGSVTAAAIIAYLVAALYAYLKPESWLFSRKYRPRILRYFLKSETIALKEAQRADALEARQRQLQAEHEHTAVAGAVPNGAAGKDSKRSRRREQARLCVERVARFFGFGEGNRVALCFVVVMNVVAFLVGYITHQGYGFGESVAYQVAQGAGYALDVNLALRLLTSLRSLQTALYAASSSLAEWIHVDDPITFHISLGYLLLITVFMHVISYLVYMHEIHVSPKLQTDTLGVWDLSEDEELSGTSFADQALTFKSITGFMAVAVIIPLYLTSFYCSRMRRSISGYLIFQRVRSLWPVLYVIVLLHGNARLWVWLVFPALSLLLDQVMLRQRQTHSVVLTEASLLEHDVLRLEFEVPQAFTYQAGQYIQLLWRGEWHPFTVISAPEERTIILHIRAPPDLDWCNALRKHLLSTAPAAAALADASSEGRDPATGDLVEERRVSFQRVNLPGGPAARAGKAAVAVDAPGAKELRTSPSELPEDTIALRLSGPFGPPSGRIWNFEAVMVVGAGLDVTPLAPILRCAQQRVQQRDAILAAAGKKDLVAAQKAVKLDKESNNIPARASNEDASHGMAPPGERQALICRARTRKTDETHGMMPPGPPGDDEVLDGPARRRTSAGSEAFDFFGAALAAEQQEAAAGEEAAGERRSSPGRNEERRRSQRSQAGKATEQRRSFTKTKSKTGMRSSGSHIGGQPDEVSEQVPRPDTLGAILDEGLQQVTAGSEPPTPAASFHEALTKKVRSSTDSWSGAVEAAPSSPAAGAPQQTAASRNEGAFGAESGTARRKTVQPSAEDLVREIIPVPRHVSFHWVVRKQEEFDWFYHLLEEAIEGPGKDIVEVYMYVGQDVDASKASSLSCVNCRQAGEPNWSTVFADAKEQHVGCCVGVFLCGSSSLTSEIAYECRYHSDPPASGPQGARFVFCREHF